MPETRGLVIRDVEESSPASDAGVQAGDVIVQVDRHPVSNVEQMKRLVAQPRGGAPILMQIRRNGPSRYVALPA